MALSGDEIILNPKHTSRLNVAAGLTSAFDLDKDGALVLQRNIDGLEDYLFTEDHTDWGVY